MEIKNCKSCGRLFNYLQGQRICPACQKDLEEKFGQVKEYIWDHADATMEQIATDNDVSIQQIKQWVREERLVFSDNYPIGIECENCGKLIKSGRFCEECKNQLSNSLQSALDKPKLKPEFAKQIGRAHV